MSRFSIKNIILGIGIGIVLMSIVSIIYLAGSDPGKDLSEEDLARIAAKYGYVKQSDVTSNTSSILTTDATGTASGTEDNSTGTTTAATGTTAATTGASAATAGTTAAAGLNAEEVLFTVKSGETSEIIAANLYQSGLIANEKEFIKLVGKKGLEDKIRTGEFNISRKADLNAIIRILTR